MEYMNGKESLPEIIDDEIIDKYLTIKRKDLTPEQLCRLELFTNLLKEEKYSNDMKKFSLDITSRDLKIK